MKKYLSLLVFAVILTGFIVFNQSCKQPAPPKAIVTVVDVNNKPVEGARVIVKSANSDSAHTVIYLLNEAKPVADTRYTNAEGKVFYDFKYEAIYRVEVTKGKDRENPFVRRGLGVLILENDKTAEITIEINDQTVFN
ncbi:MAG: hypothetical protein SNJ71_05600 [Bacteroidales bacterium]